MAQNLTDQLIENIQEREIIKKILGGDLGLFEKVVDEYKGRIYNFSLNILYNKEDAEEVALEVFYRFYKELKNFKCSCKILTYLYQIAKNLCVDFLRKKKIKEVDLDAVKDMLKSNDTPEENYIKGEERRAVLLALGSLEDAYRQALILRDMEGFSYKEISGILKENLNTVKTRIKRAREKVSLQIKKMMGSDNNERL